MSLVAISSVLCRCFKAMSLVGVVPQEGLYRFIDQNDIKAKFNLFSNNSCLLQLLKGEVYVLSNDIGFIFYHFCYGGNLCT